MNRLALFAVIAAMNLQTGTFAGRTWTIEVPDQYSTSKSAQPDEQTFTVAYVPGPREDGTQPLVQVSLIDISAAKPFPDDVLKKVAATMIGGVERRREQWKVVESNVKVGELDAIRYEWSGVSIPAPDGASVRAAMRGVMIVGVDDDLAFALHTQDIVEHAEETLAQTEKSLLTFRLTERRRPAG